jgi:hypothetical protein
LPELSGPNLNLLLSATPRLRVKHQVRIRDAERNIAMSKVGIMSISLDGYVADVWEGRGFLERR